MNAEPVIIEDDDDVDMVPIVIIDEDDAKINTEEAVGPPAVEIIDLDEELPTATDATVDKKEKPMKRLKEKAFIKNLKINRLIDKIVTLCINMENSVGMPRVIYKTLLPLYRDARNTLKESDAFKRLLKKTLKLLVKDPDHKFLHIKTLCEELKSGQLRRKVPFVTLSKDLQQDPQWVTGLNSPELISSSTEKVQNIERHENMRIESSYQLKKLRAKQPKSCSTVMKNGGIVTRSMSLAIEHEKTDIIDLDNSDHESVNSPETHDNQSDVIILDATKHSDNVDSNENKVARDEDSNKENDESENNKNKLSEEETNDLLIPKHHIEMTIDSEVTTNSNTDLKRITAIEKDIAFYKRIIAELEEAEVTTDSAISSPYIRCAKLKRKIVECYKQICEINGNSDDIVKRRTIRINVADGHPPGPAKSLECYLNETIDSTGAVAFPDFADVVNCVIEANNADSLGWGKQQVLQEAAALFRQCGQALRKRRQKREYRDLLSLVRDEEESEDPAENDPILLAKLEENKLIAKVKEKEIFERYVIMENRTNAADIGDHGEARMMEIDSDKDSSDSESDSENNFAPQKNATADIINNQCEIGESSKSNRINDNFHLFVSNNGRVATPIANFNQCNIAESSSNKNVHGTMNANPATLNPILTSLLLNKSKPLQYVVIPTVGCRQVTRESSSINDNNGEIVPNPIKAPDINQETHESTESPATEGTVESSLDIKPTINVNISTENIEITTKNIENSEVPNNESSKQIAIQNHTSCNSDEAALDDPNKIKTEDVKVKIENQQISEPIDVQSMLDELGDSFECTVFDIEDPFLVIEISSDGFSEDDL